MMLPSGSWSAGTALLAVLLAITASKAQGSNSSTTPWDLSMVNYMETQVLPTFPIISAPVSQAVTNKLCRSDSRLFLESLKNGTMWAVEMFDSSAKFSTGFFTGSTYSFGSFDECLAVQAGVQGGDKTSQRFIGKYCLTTLTIPESKLEAMRNDALAKVKETINNPSYWSLNQLRLASCIPSSCTATDLRAHLSHVIPKLAQLKSIGIPVEDVEVDVNEINCSTLEDHSGVTTGQVAVLSFIFVLVTLSAFGTMIDFVIEKWPEVIKGLPKEIFLCFSLRKNLKEFFGSCNQGADLDPISALKVIFMVSIIFLHRGMFSYLGTSSKLKVTTEEFSNFQAAIARNFFIVMEAFFIMTGFLFAYTSRKQPARFNNVVSILRICLRRYIRLTPVYISSIAFIYTLSLKIGSGPIWNFLISTERGKCVDNWWTNVLYINNIINPERMCLAISWYLAADMQLYVISVPVMYFLIKKPKVGKAILGILLVTSACIPIYITYYYQWSLWAIVHPKFITEITENVKFRHIYSPSYMRGIPFFMGISAGYYIHYFRTNNLKISQMRANFIHIGVIILAVLGPLIEAILFYDDNNFDTRSVKEAVYAPFPPIFRGLAVCGVLYVFAAGKECYILKILSWNIFKPLSRLTYCAYLLHSLLQLRDIASVRSSQHFSVLSMVQLSIADSVLTFMLALVVSMLLEVPVMNLEKVIFSSGESNVNNKIKVKRSNDQKLKSEDL